MTTLREEGVPGVPPPGITTSNQQEADSNKLTTSNAGAGNANSNEQGQNGDGKRDIHPDALGLWNARTKGRYGTADRNLKELDPAAWELFNTLRDAGVAIWTAHPNPNYFLKSGERSGEQEFYRPKGWPRITYIRATIEGFTEGDCLCANTGPVLAVVDVDPRNGGDIEAVRTLLRDLGVRIFAEVDTPGGGKHFYAAGHPDLPSKQTIEGWPGVEIKCHKTCITLPGTQRQEYGGAGYNIVFDDLLDLPSGDPEGAQALCEWVIENSPNKNYSLSNGQSGVFEGDLHNISPYAVKALNEECRILAGAPEGEREMQTNKSALKLGHLVGGGELPEEHVVDRLFAACEDNEWIDDVGMDGVLFKIRHGLEDGKMDPKNVPQDRAGINDEFWHATDTLKHIRKFARARQAGPLAVLGASMARAVASVPPTVQLPPWIGSNASLNLFLGLVAGSGIGKGVAERVAEDAFVWGAIHEAGIGSGEGINHLFAHYDRATGATKMDRHRVLFSVPEIDTLSALGNRNGATLVSQLRKAWSGEALSFSYADKQKALDIFKHTYRLALVAGIQPGRGRALIEDADGGTPQRFVWLPTDDPDAPDEPDEAPRAMDLRPISQEWPEPGTIRPHILKLPDRARKMIRSNRTAVLRGESTDSTLDGHLGLCRMKVAAALALLHNEREVSEQFWDLSGVVMETSLKTRTTVERYLADQNDKTNRARGRADGIRSIEAENVREAALVKKVSQSIVHVLEELDGSGSWSVVRKKLWVQFRDLFDEAIDALVAVGAVEVVASQRGKTIRLVEK
jgi:hypothetical protein